MKNARAGTVAAAIYNVNRKPGTDPITWKDIFPEKETRSQDQVARELLIRSNMAARSAERRRHANAR